jgi:alpha-tubulin suppressor-like RCC1 family protein
MANRVVKTFTANGSITIPAGVGIVTCVGRRAFPGLQKQSNSFIDPLGNAYIWGRGTSGQLGNATATTVSSPVVVLGGLNLLSCAIDANTDNSTFGITTQGQLYGWGINSSGQLGTGNVTAVSSPTAVLGSQRYRKVVAKSNVLALTLTGQLYSWGNNPLGVTGNGTATGTPNSSPIIVLGGLTWQNMMKINSSADNSYGLTTAGAIYGWGANANGQLGVGDVTARSSPVIALGGLTFQAFDGGSDLNGFNYVLALTTAGAAYAWGGNSSGQLGVGDVTARSSPVAVLGGLTFASIYCNALGSNYGLTAAGVAYAWGLNTNGQLGVGDVTARSSPVAVLGGLTFAKLITYGGDLGSNSETVYGLTAAGALYAWGLNNAGQLGVGDVIPRSSPVAVLGGLTFIDVQVGNANAATSVFGLTSTGQVYGWGANSNGDLGLGDVNARSSPVAILGGLLANTNDIFTTTIIPVVPGTTYAVNIVQFNAVFGTTGVGNGLSQLQVIYDQ